MATKTLIILETAKLKLTIFFLRSRKIIRSFYLYTLARPLKSKNVIHELRQDYDFLCVFVPEGRIKMKRSDLNLLPWTKLKSLGSRVDSLHDFHQLQGYAPLGGKFDAGGPLKAAQDVRFVQAQLYRDHYQTRIKDETRFTPILTFNLEGSIDAKDSDGVILAPDLLDLPKNLPTCLRYTADSREASRRSSEQI